MKRFVPGFLALGFTLLLAGSAQALQLTGDFQVTGTLVPINGTATSGLLAAKALDFTAGGSAPTPGVAGTVTVSSATGSFTSLIPVNTTGLIKDFAFNQAGTANYPAPPVTSLLNIGGGTVTFDLATISIVSQVVGSLELSGTGTLHATGFTDTFGTWSFLSNNFVPNTDLFVFTATNTAIPTVTPEPSLLVLIGVGLVGLAAWGRVKTRTTK